MDKAQRRSKGEGTAPRLQADGRWRAELTIGTDTNGKRSRKVFYGATRGIFTWVTLALTVSQAGPLGSTAGIEYQARHDRAS